MPWESEHLHDDEKIAKRKETITMVKETNAIEKEKIAIV